MGEISTLFWDNGGVILTNGWDRKARQAAVAKFGLDWADFEDRHELMLNAFETGHCTLDEYVKRVVFYREHTFTPEDFKKFMFDQSQAWPDALAFLGSISKQKKYLVAALNNESREINEYRIKTFRLRDYFEAFFCSCYLGVRKPNAGIYNLALQITQSTPQECVMIDDRGINLEAAREIGMRTIQVKSLAQLKTDLAALGVTAGS